MLIQKRTNEEWRNQQTVSLLISPLTYLFISQKDELVFISKLIQSICAAAIETMGTYLALWKTDGLYQLLDGVELQRSQAQLAGNLIYHSLILRRTGGSVFIKILVGIALKLLDDGDG